MRSAILTLLVAAFALVACKPQPPEPQPAPPHDGVTLIHRGVPPYQPLRYHLARGTRTASQLVCDLDVKNDGQSGPMPTLVVDLDTSVEDVLADGSAKLRVTVVRTAVRDRAGSPITGDVLLAQAAAMQGVVITQTLAPDGQLADSRVEAATGVPESARDQLDRLSRSLQQVAMRMPAESVGVGAIWRERRTLPEGGIRAISETLYTLTSVTGSTIAYTSLGLSSGPPHTIEQDGMRVEVTDTRGHAEATGSVDLSRFAFNATSSSTFSTAMNVVEPRDAPGAGPSTIEITVAIHVASIGSSPGNAPSAPMTADTSSLTTGSDGASPNSGGTAPSQPDGARPDAITSAATAADNGSGANAPPSSAAAADKASGANAPPSSATAGDPSSSATATDPSGATAGASATGHSGAAAGGAATGHSGEAAGGAATGHSGAAAGGAH